MQLSAQTRSSNLNVRPDLYRLFTEHAEGLRAASPRIADLRSEALRLKAKSLAAEYFEPEIRAVQENLLDRAIGMASVDIPVDPNQSDQINAYWGIIVAQGIAENIFSPALDPVNRTPFGVYGATLNSGRELESAGFQKYTAVSHLRFHTDGLLSDARVQIPDTVMVYNITIAYREAGYLHWLPFSIWRDFQKYVDIIGIGHQFKFELTQAAYRGKDGRIHVQGRKHLNAPIFIANGDQPAMFLNGNIVSDCGSDPEAMRNIENMFLSMAEDAGVFRVEQKERRAVFIGNKLGCHSRDTFQHATGTGNEYTRAYIRSVSMTGCFVCEDPLVSGDIHNLDAEMLE